MGSASRPLTDKFSFGHSADPVIRGNSVSLVSDATFVNKRG